MHYRCRCRKVRERSARALVVFQTTPRECSHHQLILVAIAVGVFLALTIVAVSC